MKRVLLALMIVLLPFTFGFTLYWQPVTQYTDNSPIEPANLPVLYDAWQDGVRIANGVTVTSALLVDNTKGKTSTFTVRTRLNNGAISDNAVVSLASPLGQPKPPAAPMSVGNP